MNAFGDGKPTLVPLNVSEDPFELYSRISSNHSHSFLFESLTGPKVLSETSVMGFSPRMILSGFYDKIEIRDMEGRTSTIRTSDPLAEINRFLGQSSDGSRRYVGGAVGVVNYDAIGLFEKVPIRRDATEPLMEFGIYDDGILYERGAEKPVYFYYSKSRLDDLEISERATDGAHISRMRADTDGDHFMKMVERAKQYILDGDIFQAVLSRRLRFDVEGRDLSIYESLRGLNPSPYMYHLRQGARTVIGASPEMLVRVTGRDVETFPIAGTCAVTHDEQRDRLLAEEMAHDEKEVAEHTMLVDLGRNDIGKVCKPGTVHVRDLMSVKRFSHVQHMVTRVTGTLKNDCDMFDAFRAVFPAGTVTGAPKVRAIEIIDELEDEPRGPYAGAVGYFSFNGCCDFAIAIRSVFIDGGHGFLQSGAGIVSDSIPSAELDETRRKADVMLQAIREASGR